MKRTRKTRQTQGEAVLAMSAVELVEWIGENGREIDLPEHTEESLAKMQTVATISSDEAAPGWRYAMLHAEHRTFAGENVCPFCGEACGSESQHIECGPPAV